MKNITYENRREVSSAFIDTSGHLGSAQTPLMVQDNVTECFGSFGCDGIVYKKLYNAFWVFTKAKFLFYSRPAWCDFVTLKTFPVSNSGIRTNVNTQILDSEGKKVALVLHEACVLSFENHRPLKLSSVGFPDSDFPEALIDQGFERFPSGFTEEEFVFEQIIRYCHLDMSHHMNNGEYVRFALSVFTEEYMLAHEIKEMEVHYLGESKEGQTLRFYKKNDSENPGKVYILIKEGDRSVFECSVTFAL